MCPSAAPGRAAGPAPFPLDRDGLVNTQPPHDAHRDKSISNRAQQNTTASVTSRASAGSGSAPDGESRYGSTQVWGIVYVLSRYSKREGASDGTNG